MRIKWENEYDKNMTKKRSDNFLIYYEIMI